MRKREGTQQGSTGGKNKRRKQRKRPRRSDATAAGSSREQQSRDRERTDAKQFSPGDILGSAGHRLRDQWQKSGMSAAEIWRYLCEADHSGWDKVEVDMDILCELMEEDVAANGGEIGCEHLKRY